MAWTGPLTATNDRPPPPDSPFNARAVEPTVSLDEARRRMGRTFGVDPNYWLWSPAEIRWLASEYRRGGAEVAEGSRASDRLLLGPRSQGFRRGGVI